MSAKSLRQGILVGLLALLALWLAYLIFGLAQKARVAVEKAQDTRRQYASLEERRAKLEASLAELDTERGRSAALRTAFNVARPGEEVIVVVPPASTTTPPEPSWWQKMLGWLGL